MNLGPSIIGSRRSFDWNLLHTFVVLAEAGSITAAAERLGRKQPTVSNALRRLEEQIGKKLIDRSPGMFQLTDAGQLLHREAIDIYGSITRLSTLMRDVIDEVRGHVRIAMASHVVCPLFDDSLRAFHRENPQATFTLDVMASVTALAEVVARRASMAVCLVHERSAKLEYCHLYREFFGLFCGPGHPLYGQSGLSREDLQGHSSHLEEIRRMTISGLGVGALPVHAVARDIAEGLLWRLPPYDDPPAIDVHLAWNPKARMNRAETAFLDALQQRISDTAIAGRTYA